MAPQEVRIALPGFGLPVGTLPSWRRQREKERFPHGIADYFASDGVTLRERRMLDFITRISDKPEWDRKVFDEEIVSKWKTEACKKNEAINDFYLSESMFDYCIAELREKATKHRETGMVAIMDTDATVVKSDVSISPALRESLIQTVRQLEEIPDMYKDWHPGSNEKVLDLVHPSLFPVVYGQSKALPSGVVPLRGCARYSGLGELIPEHHAGVHDRINSFGDSAKLPAWGSYQWLPSEVKFGPDGKAAIASYINNLHPEDHAELYGVLEKFVDKAIPLWNECLSWFHSRVRIDLQSTSDEDWMLPEGVKWTRTPVEEPTEEEEKEFEDMDDKEWAEYQGLEDEYNEWWESNRLLRQPEPGPFKPFAETLDRDGAKAVDLKADFKDSGLQVIVKLASIHLTPDKPEYEGGSWHIEGALNEHICATCLYYYDSDNVTDSHLAFRQSVDNEVMIMKPDQYEWSSAEALYGIAQEGPTTMTIGAVRTPAARLLAFPNVLQHQVQPFRLADAARPGHRKVLALFLVDPHVRVLSTANVPPQRRDWWAREVRRRVPRFAALPEELWQEVVARVDGFPTASWEEAVAVRDKLMAERGALAEKVNRAMDQDLFNFCEH